MSQRNSRFPGFYRQPLAERRRLIAEAGGIDLSELSATLGDGGLTPDNADKVIENALGVYALPFGVALNLRLNGRDYLVPMVVEEPSVVAAASNAAKMVRAGGGFFAEADAPIMTAQIQLFDVPDPHAASVRIRAASAELLALADQAVPGLVRRGGGARELEPRVLARDMLVVHVYVDCRDAMGANLVNTVAEALGPTVADIVGGQLGLRILSNLCDRRCVRVRCRIPVDALEAQPHDGREIAERIAQASRFAETDTYRAVTHNKGIMNGLDAVCVATGNDWRAVEAGAHAFAARGGRYQPLAVWRTKTERGRATELEGMLELPLALGTVGGTLRVHPAARLALRLLGMVDAAELGMLAASVGLASNLAALRALATDGIQRGHMAQHARSVALAAGSSGDEVVRVAALITEAREITLEAAARALLVVRDSVTTSPRQADEKLTL